jgi:hypothetical protein
MHRNQLEGCSEGGAQDRVLNEPRLACPGERTNADEERIAEHSSNGATRLIVPPLRNERMHALASCATST